MKETFDKTQSYLGMSVSKIIFDKGQQSGLFWIGINYIYILTLKMISLIKNERTKIEMWVILCNVLSINKGHSNGHEKETLQTRNFCNGNNTCWKGIYGPNIKDK